MLTKAEWRRRAVEARRKIIVDDAAHRSALAEFLAERLDRGWVVAYRAMDGEVDLDPLLAREQLGPFAVTRTPERGTDLTVHPFGGPTERHRYGFEQPTADAPVVPDREIAVVLVPGLAFDRLGARLGRGKGYYDRFLARLPAATRFVGITGGYIVAELPTESHDLSMTHLCGAFGVAETPLKTH